MANSTHSLFEDIEAKRETKRRLPKGEGARTNKPGEQHETERGWEGDESADRWRPGRRQKKAVWWTKTRRPHWNGEEPGSEATGWTRKDSRRAVEGRVELGQREDPETCEMAFDLVCSLAASQVSLSLPLRLCRDATCALPSLSV